VPPDSVAPGSFLAALNPATAATLTGYGRRRTYPAGATLLHHGEPAGHVLVLHAGWVKATSISRGGVEALLALRGPGDILGEVAAIDGRARSATVTALTTVTAHTIDRQRFLRAVEELPGLAIALLQHLSRSLRESDGKRLEYASAASSGRVVALLLELSDQYGRSEGETRVIDLPLAQKDLAAATGTSREAVARLLHTLRERGVVRTGRRRVEILQPEVLRSLSRSVSDDA
jgi:CRP/FNR family cyclic AMP-dependent transcriptional regulator